MNKNEVDIELLKKASKGNRKAQYELYQYCFHLLMPVCFRYTKNEEFAREELSTAYVKIINGLKKWDYTKGFEPWAKRITVNSIIDNYRKNKKHQYHEEIDDYKVELKMTHSNPTEESMCYNEIIQLLKQLPEGSRNVFNLYVIEGYKHDEIAKMLDYTVSNSKWHLSNARKLLQKIIINQRNIALFLFLGLV